MHSSVFAKRDTKEVETDEGREEKTYTVLRYYTVFNVEQTEGCNLTLPEEPRLAEHERIECRIQSGYSLRDAMVLWNVEMYLKMWDRDHPGMLNKVGPEFKERLLRVFAACAAEG